MSGSRIYGRTDKMLSNSLDISAKRHGLISSNISNMDTINYKPTDLDFQKTLERSMLDKQPVYVSRTHEKHMPINADQFIIFSEDSTDIDTYHLDSVNIDTEMLNLSENNIKYRVTAEMLLRKMGILRYSITEGGK